MKNHSKNPSERRFPPLYEKLIPIVLAVVILGGLVLLGIIVAVLAGVFPVAH